MAGADLVPLLAERAARDGLRLYFLGGAPDQTRKAEAILLERFPGLRIVGIDTPFVSPDDTEESRRQDAEICARINAARPDLLLVAFGNPKQELWLGRNAAQLKAAAAIGIGGSFNFLSGSVRRAPRWMQRSGLEWVYRIVQEPARLWKRYGLGLLKFGWLAGWSAAASWIGALLPNCRNPFSHSGKRKMSWRRSAPAFTASAIRSGGPSSPPGWRRTGDGVRCASAMPGRCCVSSSGRTVCCEFRASRSRSRFRGRQAVSAPVIDRR